MYNVHASLVKTDWNCLINISAFSLLLVTSWTPCVSGDTPMFSCFLDLMYFQKGFELLLWSPSLIVDLM